MYPISILQFNNVANLADRGMGTILDFKNISKESVQSSISIALEPKIQENAKTVSYSFKNRAQHPLETAIWWVEHVAATRGAPLTTSHSTFMSWYEYHSVDVVALIVSGLTLMVAIWIWMVRTFCRCNKRMFKEKAQ